jgi:hypothetical protein
LKKTLILSTLIVLFLCTPAKAACGLNWTFISETYPSGQQCVHEGFTKQVLWQVNWNDGRNNWVPIIDAGTSNFNVSPCVGCWPAFYTPFFVHAESGSSIAWSVFVQETQSGTIANNQCTLGSPIWSHEYYHNCNPRAFELEDEELCLYFGFYWSSTSLACSAVPEYDPDSPILVDVAGNGFALTNVANGIQFDISGGGVQKRIAWTSPNTDDAWLVLDRNGNSVVDNGQELFGNHTPQPEPPPEKRNGFLALAEYDKTANGGNADGLISAPDSVFGNLLLWQDVNHNGISEPSELHTLPALGLKEIDCNYKYSKRTDEFGNEFRYRAKVRDVHGSQLGRWAWDVFLMTQP